MTRRAASSAFECRSLLVRPVLAAAAMGLVLLLLLLPLGQPADAYVLQRRSAMSIRDRQQAASAGGDVDPAAAGLYFGRHLRSRVHRSSRSSRHRRDRLFVNITAPEGAVPQDEQTVLECEAVGARPSLIYWLKNGERISQENGDSLNLIVLDDGDIVKSGEPTLTTVRSKLYIDCASIDDEADYTCVAANSESTESTSYRLQVSRTPNLLPAAGCRAHTKKTLAHRIGLPARITMWTHNKLVPNGASVVLVCRTQSPNTVVNWLHEHNQQVVVEPDSERVRIRDNGDLELKNVQWEDMGGYTCLAENDVGSDRQVAFLYPYAT